MCNTELGLFCFEHNNWEHLLTQEPYFLKIKRDDDYIMFSYDQRQSDFSLNLVREARGIIFKQGHWENPVCWAFDKFGNYGESYVPEIDWSTAFVSEKIDGSLIKLWFDDDNWHVSTNGTINAYKADLCGLKYADFGNYFYSAVLKHYSDFDEFLNRLNKDITYMFELVGPDNRVVIKYKEPEVYFLGARNKYTGQESWCTSDNALVLNVTQLPLPKTYKLNSLDDCIKVAEEFVVDHEGFVVVDDKGNRVKVKSPAYVMAHYLRTNSAINKKHLIRVILQNETEEFLCYADEYEEELLNLKKKMTAFLNVGNLFAKSCEKAAELLDRSAYASFVKTLPRIYQGLLFSNYNKPTTAEEFTSVWNENKWEEYLDNFENLINEILGGTKDESL